MADYTPMNQGNNQLFTPANIQGKSYQFNKPISDLGPAIASNMLTSEVPKQNYYGPTVNPLGSPKSVGIREGPQYQGDANLREVIVGPIKAVTSAPVYAGRFVAEEKYSPEIRNVLRQKVSSDIASKAYGVASGQDQPIDIGGVKLETNLPVIGNVGLPGSSIPGYTAYAYSTQNPYAQRFVAVAREEYTKRGFSQSKAQELANALAYRELLAGGLGEAGSTVASGAGSQAIGAKLLSRELVRGSIASAGRQLTQKELASQLTRQSFRAIAPAGVFEGGTTYISSAEARRQELTPAGFALSAGFGGAFAGLLGAGIARTSITAPTKSKALTGISYLIDPYELPGDLYEAGLRRSVPQLRRPAGYRGGIFNIAPQDTIAEAKRRGFVSEQAENQLNRLGLPSNTQTPRGGVPTNTPKSPTNIFNFVIGPQSPRPGPGTPIPIGPGIPTTTEPIRQPPLNIFSNEPVPSNVPANVPVNPFVPVNVPVVSPLPRNLVLPPLFGLPTGPSGPGYSSRRRTRIIDELEKSRIAFLRFF